MGDKPTVAGAVKVGGIGVTVRSWWGELAELGLEKASVAGGGYII